MTDIDRLTRADIRRIIHLMDTQPEMNNIVGIDLGTPGIPSGLTLPKILFAKAMLYSKGADNQFGLVGNFSTLYWDLTRDIFKRLDESQRAEYESEISWKLLDDYVGPGTTVHHSKFLRKRLSTDKPVPLWGEHLFNEWHESNDVVFMWAKNSDYRSPDDLKHHQVCAILCRTTWYQDWFGERSII